MRFPEIAETFIFVNQNVLIRKTNARNYRGIIFLYVWYNIDPRATQVQSAAHVVPGGCNRDSSAMTELCCHGKSMKQWIFIDFQ